MFENNFVYIYIYIYIYIYSESDSYEEHRTVRKYKVEERLIDNTGLQLKFPGLHFQCFVCFCPANYENECNFFSSRSEFPNF